MSIETDALGALLVVLAMALVTLATRWGGVWVMSFVPIGYPVGAGHGSISRRPVAKMAFQDSWGSVFGG